MMHFPGTVLTVHADGMSVSNAHELATWFMVRSQAGLSTHVEVVSLEYHKEKLRSELIKILESAARAADKEYPDADPPIGKHPFLGDMLRNGAARLRAGEDFNA